MNTRADGGGMMVAPRQTDEVLPEQSEWLRVTLASIGDGVITCNNSGHVTFLNPVAEALTGWTQDEAAGAPLELVFKIINEETRRTVENPASRALREGNIVGLANHTVLIGKDGVERFIDDSAAPIRNQAGAIIGCVLIFRDITARKRAEERLRASEEQRRLALDSAELGAWNIDPATNLLVSDERFRIIFHGSTAPITYEEAFAALHPDDWQRIRDGVAAATNPDDPAPYAEEYRVVHPDGTIRWVFGKGRANFVATEAGRRLASFDGTAMDITDRKGAEQQLHASEERQAYLVKLGDALRLLSDAHEVQAAASRVLGEHLAANRVIYFEIRGAEYIIAHDYARGVQPLAGRYPVEAFGPAVLAALRAGQLVTVHDVATLLDLDAAARAAHAVVGVAAYVAVPLVKGGALVAGLAAHSAQPRRWTAAEISLLEETAERTWAAVERARAETALRASESRFRLLDALGEATRNVADPEHVMLAAARLLGEHLRVTRCAYADVELDNDSFTIRDDWTIAGVTTTAGTYSLDLFGPRAAADMRAGRTLIVRDVDAELAGSGGAEMFNAIGIKAIICCPLVKDGQLRAMMAVHNATPRDWTNDEMTLMQEVAERSWAHIERVRSAAVMQASEDRYRTLFESMDEGYCVIDLLYDADGRPIDYRYLEVNPAFEAQSGLSHATGRRILEMVPSIEQHWLVNFGQVVVTGEPVRFTNEVKGLGRWFEVYAFQLGAPGSTKLAVLFTDVTARRRAEQERERLLGELQNQDRRKDEFLAMLSHELRSPLAPISNAVQLLRHQRDEDPVQQQARTIIERQVGQLKHLIDDLLEVSRITTGRVQLRQERIATSGIVERAVETARPLIAGRRHELTVTVASQPIWLHADAARLEQVVVNLLTNAAKYTDEGGRIWLTVKQENDEAVLRVRDTGVGIAPELLPHIFDLFTQAERSLARSEGGLGIGLALVERLVKLHGGRVEAISALGLGSEFIVRLPVIVSPAAPAAPSAAPIGPAGKYCRVLVVDDNVDSAESLALLLRMSKHDVRTAHDGVAALEAAFDYRPDVVLLDIGLPKLDGYEVAKKLRQQPAFKNVVLVAMTGYGQESDRQHSHEAGFDHHLVKPADFRRVKQILASVSEKAT